MPHVLTLSLLCLAAAAGLGVAFGLHRVLERARRAHSELEETARNLEEIVAERTRELRNSERKYRSLVGQASIGILIWDPVTGEIQEANAKVAELLGARPRDLLGERADSLLAPEDRDRGARALARMQEAGAVHLADVQLAHRQSAPIAGELSASLVRFGREAVVLGLVRDLTETKVLEQRATLLSAQVRRTEREATIGQLAAGIAHEINNPMGYVSSNLNRLIDFSKQLVDGVRSQRIETGESSDLFDLIGEIESIADETREGVDRVIEIVQALLEFSHGGQRKTLQEVDLNRVIRNCLTLVPRWARERVDLDLRPIPLVPCHPMQIAQVVMNLVINGAQAVGDEGRVEVNTRASRRHVYVSVCDDGRGIPEEHLSQICDPFFTTKPVGTGTGLGLAVSSEIVKRHEGHLWIDSVEGRGSLFVLELPRERSVTEEPEPTGAGERASGDP